MVFDTWSLHTHYRQFYRRNRCFLEQFDWLSMYILKNRSKVEISYSQNPREVVVVFWGVNSQLQYLFGVHLSVVTDHKVLTRICYSMQCLAALSAASYKVGVSLTVHVFMISSLRTRIEHKRWFAIHRLHSIQNIWSRRLLVTSIRIRETRWTFARDTKVHCPPCYYSCIVNGRPTRSDKF